MNFLLKSSTRDLRVALYLGSAAFFALLGYEFARSSVNTLYKTAYGVETLPWMLAINPVGLLLMVALYQKSLKWFGARRTLLYTTYGSALLFALGFTMVHLGFAWVIPLLFILKSGYIVLLIEQYWSFINSIYSIETAKLLNGPIIGLSSIGAIAGGIGLHYLVERLGTPSMVLFTAISLIPAGYFSSKSFYLEKKEGSPRLIAEDRTDSWGLRAFRSFPSLKWILLIVLATQVMAASLQLRFQTSLQLEIPDPDRQTGYSGLFFAYLNMGALFFQFVVSPVVMRVLHPAKTHFLIPLVHVAFGIIFLKDAGLFAAAASYMAFKCLDYSLFRVAKEILYIPMSFEARYRAKELIDVLGYRFGKGGMSAVFAALEGLGFSALSLYSWVTLGSALIWFLMVFPIKKYFLTNKADLDLTLGDPV